MGEGEKLMGKHRNGKKNMRIKIAMSACVIFVLGTGIFGIFSLHGVKALINDDDTVHVKDEQIGVSSLIVGTHIMYLGAVTDELYATAAESAKKVGMYEVYYKSELADGSWYEISGAEGLADISTSGKIVTADVIENLNLQYYTKEDGITYDLRTGGAVNVFDIDNPYDLGSNSDMEDIKTQYDMLSGKEEKTKSDEYYIGLIDDFFSEELDNSETKELDDKLDSLWRVYQNADDDMREQLMSVMGELDDKRRSIVGNQLLSGMLDELLDKVGLSASSDNELVMNNQLYEAVGNAINEVAQTTAECESNLPSGDSGFTQVQEELKEKLIAAAQSGNADECKNICSDIKALNNIQSGISGDSAAELEILKELVDKQYGICTDMLEQGAGAEYDNIKQTSSDTVARKYLNARKNELDKSLTELADMLDKAAGRMGRDSAKEYLDKAISDIEGLGSRIKSDDFEKYAIASLNKCAGLIEDKYKSVAASGSNRMDSLLADREQNIINRLDALDKNDYEQALLYENRIEHLDEEIAAYEKELNAIIESPNSTAAQKQNAMAQLNSQGLVANINSIAEETVENIQNGDLSTVLENIDVLSAFSDSNPSTLLNALTDIYSGLEEAEFNMTLSQEQKDVIEQAKDKIADSVSSNAKAFVGNSITVDSVYAAIEEITGMSFDSLDDRMKIVAIVAVNSYAKTIDSEILYTISSAMASKAFGSNNDYIYKQLKDGASDYVSSEAISRVMGYRYIYSDTNKNVILQKGIDYYSFTAFDKRVSERDGYVDEMTVPAKLQGTVYIPDDYATEHFRCYVFTIERSDYSVVIKPDMENEIIDFTSAFIKLLLD